MITTQRIDGKHVSQQVLATLAQQLSQLPDERRPRLCVLMIGDNPASQVYVSRKAEAALQVGMRSEVIRFPSDTDQDELLSEIERLNHDASVHGILVQLPLPDQLDTKRVLTAIAPAKDVDGFHPENMGRLLSGDFPPALPCTPTGMMQLLAHYHIPIAGQHAVIVGRSTIVGKPMGLLLLQQDATVTYCHSKTRDLEAVTRHADILIAAVGVPRLVTGDMMKPGAVVLDVGINRQADGKLVGDVDYDSAQGVASFITPVPGGVGPMTIATLLTNTLALFQHQLALLAPV
jgi:methylenetetrahydrofolate dehydrogenase (NADP+) / methenyltetrahydrofolate cyclohydrolase